MQRELPDDLRKDVPLDIQGALRALRFQLDRAYDTLEQLEEATMSLQSARLEEGQMCGDNMPEDDIL